MPLVEPRVVPLVMLLPEPLAEPPLSEPRPEGPALALPPELPHPTANRLTRASVSSLDAHISGSFPDSMIVQCHRQVEARSFVAAGELRQARDPGHGSVKKSSTATRACDRLMRE